ncbi:hypothetical protein CR513_01657, partial [Mucuna pruriens]
MKDSKPGETLIAKGDKFSLKQYPNNDLKRNEMQKIPYASIVRSLMYLSDLEMQHWKVVKRVMRYLRRIKRYMLTYQKFEGLEIIRYFDSNFTGCQDTGYIYMLVGRAISWKSSLWLASRHPTMGYDCETLSLVYRSSTKSKFIDIKFLVVKERVHNKQISIEHIGTSFMLGDSLTKGLIPKVFHEHTAHMGKRETKVSEENKVVWLRKTTNRLAIAKESTAISK